MKYIIYEVAGGGGVSRARSVAAADAATRPDGGRLELELWRA